jgi:hypothetical protein
METASRGAPRRVDLRTAASRRHLYAAIDEDGEPSNRNEGYSPSWKVTRRPLSGS